MKNIGGYPAVYPACYELNMPGFLHMKDFRYAILKPEEYLAEHLKRVAIKVIITGKKKFRQKQFCDM